ncbi:hypothetical protein PMIN01_10944 [Paraphaeosphaeria minitans]|uniref:Uncharacterized protein n=1 Tax=Paraphaeosphaeria minitans TaxID=565426 RepID=A0A9P6G8B5_9PLEO|nr:hypothetical protein PMIN01_10944 [Paraphaeosphaeria minitans]
MSLQPRLDSPLRSLLSGGRWGDGQGRGRSNGAEAGGRTERQIAIIIGPWTGRSESPVAGLPSLADHGRRRALAAAAAAAGSEAVLGSTLVVGEVASGRQPLMAWLAPIGRAAGDEGGSVLRRRSRNGLQLAANLGTVWRAAAALGDDDSQHTRLASAAQPHLPSGRHPGLHNLLGLDAQVTTKGTRCPRVSTPAWTPCPPTYFLLPTSCHLASRLPPTRRQNSPPTAFPGLTLPPRLRSRRCSSSTVAAECGARQFTARCRLVLASRPAGNTRHGSRQSYPKQAKRPGLLGKALDRCRLLVDGPDSSSKVQTGPSAPGSRAFRLQPFRQTPPYQSCVCVWVCVWVCVCVCACVRVRDAAAMHSILC